MADGMGFRVCVDAREVCKDMKSCFFMYIDLLRDRYIHDIENRVMGFLNVDKPISLMIGGIYLPSSENVRLLCADDVLKVTKQSWQFHDDKRSADDPCKDDNNGYNRICLKEKKNKRKKYNVSGDVDNSCSAVNENVQRNELQNLHESDECRKDKGKKRKSRGNRSNVSGEPCALEQSRCEVLLEDVHHLVEEGRERKICKRKSTEEDKKLNDGISDSIMSVKRTSEYVTTRPNIPSRESQENGIVSSIKIDINTETIQSNEHLITKDTSAKSRRKRTRRHKKKHNVEDDNVKREFPAITVNPKRETLIRSVAAPRTHIRFSDSNGDNVDTVNDEVETCHITSQTECDRTHTGHISSEPCSLEPLVISTDVGAVSSELNLNQVRKLNHLSSNEQTSTKWDVQVSDTSQCGDLLCNGSSGNNHAFAKLLAFENSSTPRVYQRKKNSVTTDGTIQETLSNADMETREDVKTDDKKIDFSVYPLLKEIPMEKDIIVFKMLRMGEDYTPQVSDYITAQVLSICKESCQLMLKILDGSKQCQQPKGKFSLEDESSPDVQTVESLEVNWNEILETRLLYP